METRYILIEKFVYFWGKNDCNVLALIRRCNERDYVATTRNFNTGFLIEKNDIVNTLICPSETEKEKYFGCYA